MGGCRRPRGIHPYRAYPRVCVVSPTGDTTHTRGYAPAITLGPHGCMLGRRAMPCFSRRSKQTQQTCGIRDPTGITWARNLISLLRARWQANPHAGIVTGRLQTHPYICYRIRSFKWARMMSDKNMNATHTICLRYWWGRLNLCWMVDGRFKHRLVLVDITI